MPLKACRTAAILAILSTPALASTEFSVATHPDHGPYLTGPGGLPVYAMITTGSGTDGLPALQSCNQRCRTDWPLVTIGEDPELGDGLDPQLFETVTDKDRNVAVYNAWRLFYYAGDEQDTPPSGHGIHTYGGWWALVRPDGTAIRTGIMPGADGS